MKHTHRQAQKILTGNAKAASKMELTPSSGSCRSLKSLNIVNATLERYVGTSLMMFVLTTPGSATLQNMKEIIFNKQKSADPYQKP